MRATVLILLSLLSFNASAKLSPLQIHSIQNGWHAPYSQETIDKVLDQPKLELPDFRFQVPLYVPQNAWEEPADNWMWALFWGIQLADIYSTHEGVKYDCIQEANPLLPSIPTIAEMAVLKSIVLLPTYGSIGYDNITRGELMAPLILGGIVVHNNLRLVNKAEDRCNLR